jgi:hypothetical protein
VEIVFYVSTRTVKNAANRRARAVGGLVL